MGMFTITLPYNNPDPKGPLRFPMFHILHPTSHVLLPTAYFSLPRSSYSTPQPQPLPLGRVHHLVYTSVKVSNKVTMSSKFCLLKPGLESLFRLNLPPRPSRKAIWYRDLMM